MSERVSRFLPCLAWARHYDRNALSGDLVAKPVTNTAFLAIGAAIASFIGTTGASMLLIRPMLQTNSERKHVVHTIVFFIFLVSNIGGTLLPIGDPPLFLGYLRGVNFFWTMGLWKEWAFCCMALLLIYLVWDTLAYRRETPRDIERDVRRQYQWAAGTDLEPLEYGNTRLDQRVCLGDQRIECQDDAVADQAADPVAQNAGGNEVEHRLLAVDDERVPRIVTTLESRDGRSTIGEEIDDLPLALITPLGANDDDILAHCGYVSCCLYSAANDEQQDEAGNHDDQPHRAQVIVT